MIVDELKPIVVVNKIDRPGARIDWVINQTFDLFDKLGASEEQLDFPIVYASGLNGYASLSADAREGDMRPLFEAILEHVPVRPADPAAPLQLQITSLDYSTYVGRIGVGRINRGSIKPGQQVALRFGPEGEPMNRKINQVLSFKGLERVQVDSAEAGDIVLINGIEEIGIGVTICSPEQPEALPMITVDEPTLTMNFLVNSSPLAGREGKFVTSRQIRDRLMKELNHNVALRVKDTGDETTFEVAGRGELHLTILVAQPYRAQRHAFDGTPQPAGIDDADADQIEKTSVERKKRGASIIRRTPGDGESQPKEIIPPTCKPPGGREARPSRRRRRIRPPLGP